MGQNARRPRPPLPKSYHTRFWPCAQYARPERRRERWNASPSRPAWACARLVRRAPDSHKGAYGKVLAVCGCERYRGAAALAVLGALRAGAGLVTLAAPECVAAAVAPRALEATFLPLPEWDDALEQAAAEATACVLGCGRAADGPTRTLMQRVLRAAAGTVVLDAGGPVRVRGRPCAAGGLGPRAARLVVTPHPGEAGAPSGLHGGRGGGRPGSRRAAPGAQPRRGGRIEGPPHADGVPKRHSVRERHRQRGPCARRQRRSAGGASSRAWRRRARPPPRRPPPACACTALRPTAARSAARCRACCPRTSLRTSARFFLKMSGGCASIRVQRGRGAAAPPRAAVFAPKGPGPAFPARRRTFRADFKKG